MRESTTRSAAWTVVIGLVVTTAGCAARADRGAFNCDRRWGGGTVAGALAGAAIGGGLGGGIVATSGEFEHQAKDYAVGIGVGTLTGAMLGALFGHCAFDQHWAEAPPPPPPPPAPRPTPRPRQKIVLRGVNFDFDKSTIRRDSADTLDEAAVILRDQPEVNVFVDGYTDSIGSDAYNERLSERRAQAVVAYLSEHGVGANRLRARGFGKTRPVASNATEEGRAQNRRVELNITGAHEPSPGGQGESYKEKRQRLREQQEDEDSEQQ
jgi:outer membrane protein OmpA-like peptidoglycan-associated protein